MVSPARGPKNSVPRCRVRYAYEWRRQSRRVPLPPIKPSRMCARRYEHGVGFCPEVSVSSSSCEKRSMTRHRDEPPFPTSARNSELPSTRFHAFSSQHARRISYSFNCCSHVPPCAPSVENTDSALTSYSRFSASMAVGLSARWVATGCTTVATARSG